MNYELLDLLLDAESAAQDGEEEEFTDIVRECWLTYGPECDLSESDINKLKQIAGRLK